MQSSSLKVHHWRQCFHFSVVFYQANSNFNILDRYFHKLLYVALSKCNVRHSIFFIAPFSIVSMWQISHLFVTLKSNDAIKSKVCCHFIHEWCHSRWATDKILNIIGWFNVNSCECKKKIRYWKVRVGVLLKPVVVHS